MPHAINSCALTGEKLCINKAVHALLMHGYATFSMNVPGPQICCHYEMCTARPKNEHSPQKLRLQDIGEKAKQNSARSNVKCSKCIQFLCNNSDRTWFLNALTFARSLGLGFQHLPRDLANVNAWKTKSDPYIVFLLFALWRLACVFTVWTAQTVAVCIDVCIWDNTTFPIVIT